MTERNRYLTKGIRDRCTSARNLCARIEQHSGDVTEALERSFAPFLGGPELEQGVRRVTLCAINAIRQLITRLLDTQWTLHELEVQGSQERERKNQAIAALHHMLTSFRRAQLWDRGPLVPKGRIPWQPEHLLAEAAKMRPRLDSPHLRVTAKPFPGFEPAPGLGTELEEAMNELETALTEFGRTQHACAAAREERDEAMEELHAYVTAVRGLLRAVMALPATKGC